MNKLQFLLAGFLLVFIGTAQEKEGGWQALLAGDFNQAETIFNERLQKDSTDITGLQGMIFLSEVKENFLNYNKYITTYVNNHWDEDIFLLFRESYDGKTDAILKSPMSERAKMENYLDSAFGILRYTHDKGKSNKMYRSVIQDFKWSFLGPFESYNGSGYLETFEAEKDSYDPEKTYLTEYGEPRQWVEPKYSGPSGRALNYMHLTMNTSEPNVNYANTFITNPTQQKVQFRLTRSAPIKVYLDDDLIYENADISVFMYDKEILELDLAPGTHRILVKSAAYFPISNANFNLNFRDYPNLEQDEFTLRITDVNGKVISGITSSFRGTYEPRDYQGKVNVKETSLVEAFDRRLAESDNHPFYYYALNKAYIKEGEFKQGEARFIVLHRENPGSVFFNFLISKVFSAADKSERVYATLGGTDYDRSPIFQMLWEKHSEIDLDNEEEKFFTSVNRLLDITPSNMRAIRAKIRYYNKVGKEKEKDAFIDETIKAFPKYKENIEEEKSTFKKKKDGANTDYKERLDEQKRAIKTIKKEFDYQSYQNAIAYYKTKKKSKQVKETYDRMIAARPQFASYRIDKVKYLFDQGDYTEALAELDTCLMIKPIYPQVFDLQGDIYYQLDKKDLALEAYLKTKATRNSGGTSYYARDLDAKIEKIRGRKSYKSIFETPDFNDVLASESWYPMADGEEALVLQYAKDLVLKDNKEVEVYQKFMVLILTEDGAKKWISQDYDFLGNLQSYKLIKADGTEVIPEYSYGTLVFKNLEPGDLIQLEGTSSYTTHDAFSQALLDRHFIFFDDPVFYAKYEVAIPKEQQLYYQVHKIEDTKEEEIRGDFKHYNWTYLGLLGVRYEEAVVDQIDPYPNITISNIEDWQKTVRWYLGETYRKLDITYDVKEVLDTLIKPDMTPLEKVQAVYTFVTGQVKYSFVPFYNSAFIPKDPTNTLSSMIGDCKDVSTLMLTMLKALDIESYYTLVKTRQMDHLENIPSINFDHVIVAYILDGDTAYADLTTDYFPMEVLPNMDLGANALLIKSGVTADFKLPEMHLDPQTNQLELKMRVELKNDRSLTAKADVTYQGIIAGMMREQLTRLPVSQHDDFLADRISDNVFSDLELQDFEFQRLKNIESNLKSSMSFKANGFLDPVSNLFIFQMPYALDIPTTSVLSNKIRTNRIHLGKILETTPSRQEIDIIFPKGYQLTALPKPIKINHKYGDYEVRFSNIPGGMRVVKTQVFHKDIFDINEFEEFKEFYRKLMDADKMKVAIMSATAR
ncbi:MAG: DUF3857 domain-containing protein [Schleiferiaceae bacterium]|nr:DUF3857 domain-containing protein [Schleiferiaceae bacterium]